MRFPDWLKVYGDRSYRGPCNQEETEQIDFFSHLLCHHPEVARLMIHPQLSGKRNRMQIEMAKKMGALNKGASDIIIPGGPCFVMELKRKDHTRSHWEKGQLPYFEAAQDRGAFCCVALGWEAAMVAVREWLQCSQK